MRKIMTALAINSQEWLWAVLADVEMAHSPALVSFLDLAAARSAKRYPPELDRPSDPPRTVTAAAASSFRLNTEAAQPAQPTAAQMSSADRRADTPASSPEASSTADAEVRSSIDDPVCHADIVGLPLTVPSSPRAQRTWERSG
jgi:hypothetical protein